jgi:predicted nuclease of predicted toxin-antitoxin system
VKILLDECLPVDLRAAFRNHQAHSVDWAELKGKKNGDLLRAAEAAGYGALVTVDQGIRHEQNLRDRAIGIVVLLPRTNQLEDLIPVVEGVEAALATLAPGQVIEIA